MEKYGFIYIWYDRKHKRYYIGCHWGTLDDGYICSSTWMKQGYKHRPEDFKRRILETNIDKINLHAHEYEWLKLIKEDELGKRYYNLHNHHFGYWSTDESIKTTIVEKRKKSLETSAPWKAFCEAQKGRKLSDETKEKLRQKAMQQFSDPEKRRKAGEANRGNSYRKGKKASPETLEKMRQAGLNQSSESREKMRFALTGKKHSEETKQKMRGPRGPQKNPRKKKIMEV